MNDDNRRMPLTYTEADLGPHDIGPNCRGRGHFFVHDKGPDFCLMVIKDVPVKGRQEENEEYFEGAFHCGDCPAFIENRNLHQLPQGGRGSVVMFNPVPKKLSPSQLVPGTIYHYGIMNYIFGGNDTIELYEFNNPTGKEDQHGDDWCIYRTSICTLQCEEEPFEDFLKYRCKKRTIKMGAHSIFFVNQIEGNDIMDFGELQFEMSLVNNTDSCYQCATEGPDVFFPMPDIFSNGRSIEDDESLKTFSRSPSGV